MRHVVAGEHDECAPEMYLQPPQIIPESRLGPSRVAIAIALALGLFITTVVAIAVYDGSQSDRPDPAPQKPRTVLDHTSVQHMIQDWGYTGVVCNHGIDPELIVHAHFSCVADGNQQILITITNAKGDYVWGPTS
jgi:hypothetical protein